MNSFDLNIDHRCFYELPAHFIFIFTGFSPFTHVDDPMMTSCLDLSKTQSILFSLLWCSFEVDVSSSDLTIDSASCCIFSDFFGIYVQLDNRCCSLIVIDLLIEWSSWALWTDLSSWPRLLTSYMCLFTQLHDDLNIYVKMMKSFNILIFNPFLIPFVVTVGIGLYSLTTTKSHVKSCRATSCKSISVSKSVTGRQQRRHAASRHSCWRQHGSKWIDASTATSVVDTRHGADDSTSSRPSWTGDWVWHEQAYRCRVGTHPLRGHSRVARWRDDGTTAGIRLAVTTVIIIIVSIDIVIITSILTINITDTTSSSVSIAISIKIAIALTFTSSLSSTLSVSFIWCWRRSSSSSTIKQSITLSRSSRSFTFTTATVISAGRVGASLQEAVKYSCEDSSGR